jgi:hypothetical protein
MTLGAGYCQGFHDGVQIMQGLGIVSENKKFIADKKVGPKPHL